MKVMVTGCQGMLGRDIISVFSRMHEVIGADIQDFDITEICSTEAYIKKHKPGIVIHCAAYTSVDECETNIDKAFRINALGTRNIASVCDEIKATMIYISSDYVYDGTKKTPYFEYDLANPINIYGRSKLEGEKFVQNLCSRHYIVRTSWLFGKNGNNFVKVMLKLAQERKIVSVVNDQYGSPTYTLDLAKALLKLITKQAYGVYHITNEDYCSWYEFAQFIFQTANIRDIDVIPISTEDLARPAPRPKNSVLEKFYLRLNGYSIPRSYQQAVSEYIANL